MNVLKAIEENSKELDELKSLRLSYLKKVVDINAEIAALSTITDFAALHKGSSADVPTVLLEDKKDVYSE